ncbi:hypothetical protein N8612_02460 [Verrucomicrobia bacterium]|nr:hypothetical protein [Verrucomicrobiota bacterium]
MKTPTILTSISITLMTTTTIAQSPLPSIDFDKQISADAGMLSASNSRILPHE